MGIGTEIIGEVAGEATGLKSYLRIAKIVGGVLVVLAFVGLILTIRHLNSKIDAANVWQGAVIEALSAETLPPGTKGVIKPATVPQRIHDLGALARDRQVALDTQTKGATAAGAVGQTTRDEAHTGAQKALAADQGLIDLAKRLRAPAASTAANAATSGADTDPVINQEDWDKL